MRVGRAQRRGVSAIFWGWTLLFLSATWMGPLPARAQAGADEAATAAAGALALAEEALRQALGLANHDDHAEALRRKPALRQELENARRFLGYARSGLETANARPSAAAYQDVKVLAERATKGLNEYRDNVQAVFTQLEVERRPPPPPPPPPPPEPEPEPEPTPAPQDTAAESAPAAPAAQVDTAADTPATPGPQADEPTASPTASPADSPSETAPSAAPPVAASTPPASPGTSTGGGGRAALAPRSLRQAVAGFIGGDYAKVVDELKPEKYRRQTRRAQAFLLRAASRYALFLLGGEDDYKLRGEASADIVAARKADADIEPSEAAFSPRFRDFFTATR